MSRRKRIIQETEPDSWKRDCYDWLQMLTFVLVGVVLVFTFLGMVIGVSGTSMYPTLHHQDIMVTSVSATPQPRGTWWCCARIPSWRRQSSSG